MCTKFFIKFQVILVSARKFKIIFCSHRHKFWVSFLYSFRWILGENEQNCKQWLKRSARDAYGDEEKSSSAENEKKRRLVIGWPLSCTSLLLFMQTNVTGSRGMLANKSETTMFAHTHTHTQWKHSKYSSTHTQYWITSMKSNSFSFKTLTLVAFETCIYV